MSGIERIAKERNRQIEEEGRSLEDDLQYTNGELALAGASYAIAEDHRLHYRDETIPVAWPWSDEWWKPSPHNRIRELEKAGALLAAEIDRLEALESIRQRNSSLSHCPIERHNDAPSIRCQWCNEIWNSRT